MRKQTTALDTATIPDRVSQTMSTYIRDITPTFRYSDDDLVVFELIVRARIEMATTEFLYLQDQLQGKGDRGLDLGSAMDDGGAALETEYIGKLATRQRMHIANLENALVRIRNKTYGICRETGNLIDRARLKAVPHATLCVEAKARR